MNYRDGAATCIPEQQRRGLVLLGSLLRCANRRRELGERYNHAVAPCIAGCLASESALMLVERLMYHAGGLKPQGL